MPDGNQPAAFRWLPGALRWRLSGSLHCLSDALIISSLAGALSLSADAIANRPSALPVAASLGLACGSAAGLILATGRFITQLLPPWVALGLWCGGGAALGFLGAAGVGA